VFFGLQGVLTRVTFDHGTNVAGGMAGRAAAVAPLVILLAFMPVRRMRARSAARLLVPMTAISVVNTITYFVAIDRMSPALVVLIIYVYPALAVLGSRLLGWTRVTGLTVVAVVATVGGVVLTIGLPEGTVDPLAAVLALANGTLYACWLLFAQAALRRADALTCFIASNAVAQALILVGAVSIGDPVVATDAVGILSLVAVGTLSTTVAFLLQLGGISRLGGAATGLIMTLEIVTVVALSAALFDDPLGAVVVVGSVLIVAGAALAPLSTQSRRAPVAPRAAEL
jgi:drug/metabolite transporter (DMT)-like permease